MPAAHGGGINIYTRYRFTENLHACRRRRRIEVDTHIQIHNIFG